MNLQYCRYSEELRIELHAWWNRMLTALEKKNACAEAVLLQQRCVKHFAASTQIGLTHIELKTVSNYLPDVIENGLGKSIWKRFGRSSEHSNRLENGFKTVCKCRVKGVYVLSIKCISFIYGQWKGMAFMFSIPTWQMWTKETSLYFVYYNFVHLKDTLKIESHFKTKFGHLKLGHK